MSQEAPGNDYADSSHSAGPVAFAITAKRTATRDSDAPLVVKRCGRGGFSSGGRNGAWGYANLERLWRIAILRWSAIRRDRVRRRIWPEGGRRCRVRRRSNRPLRRRNGRIADRALLRRRVGRRLSWQVVSGARRLGRRGGGSVPRRQPRPRPGSPAAGRSAWRRRCRPRWGLLPLLRRPRQHPAPRRWRSASRLRLFVGSGVVGSPPASVRSCSGRGSRLEGYYMPLDM